jgi:transcriptional regulator with XRE-family HTH domain
MQIDQLIIRNKIVTQGGKNRTSNRLWLARKRRHLGQKQVAYLLGHKTPDIVSRYEKGVKLPNLQTGLMLEIIYGIPIIILFKELFESLQNKVHERIKTNETISGIFGSLLTKDQVRREFCAYEEMLKASNLSETDLSKIRRHVTLLVKKMAYL